MFPGGADSGPRRHGPRAVGEVQVLQRRQRSEPSNSFKQGPPSPDAHVARHRSRPAGSTGHHECGPAQPRVRTADAGFACAPGCSLGCPLHSGCQAGGHRCVGMQEPEEVAAGGRGAPVELRPPPRGPSTTRAPAASATARVRSRLRHRTRPPLPPQREASKRVCRCAPLRPVSAPRR